MSYLESVSNAEKLRCIVLSRHLLHYLNTVDDHTTKAFLKMRYHVKRLPVHGPQRTPIISFFC